jgi:hypothetical protein
MHGAVPPLSPYVMTPYLVNQVGIFPFTFNLISYSKISVFVAFAKLGTLSKVTSRKSTRMAHEYLRCMQTEDVLVMVHILYCEVCEINSRRWEDNVSLFWRYRGVGSKVITSGTRLRKPFNFWYA